jgi:GxxExxY protein
MVKCSICKNAGHNSATCPTKQEASPRPLPKAVEPEDITKIRQIAEEVLAELGPGHTESVYHNAMKIGLQDEGYPYESERDLPITFRGRYVGTVRADIIVDKWIVIELKAGTGSDTTVSDATEQCMCYMKETKISTGIVVVFPKRDKGAFMFKWFEAEE